MLRLRNSADRFIRQEVFSFIIEKNKTNETFFPGNFLYMGRRRERSKQTYFCNVLLCVEDAKMTDHSQRRRDFISRFCLVLMLRRRHANQFFFDVLWNLIFPLDPFFLLY